MIALSTAADKSLRAQVAETISIIARSDFPARWPDLIDVSSFRWPATAALAMNVPFSPPTCHDLRNWSAASTMTITKSTSAFWRPPIQYSTHGVRKRDPMAFSQRSTTSSRDLRSLSSNSFHTLRIYYFHQAFREILHWLLKHKQYSSTFSSISLVKICLPTSRILTFNSSDPRACS